MDYQLRRWSEKPQERHQISNIARIIAELRDAVARTFQRDGNSYEDSRHKVIRVLKHMIYHDDTRPIIVKAFLDDASLEDFEFFVFDWVLY